MPLRPTQPVSLLGRWLGVSGARVVERVSQRDRGRGQRRTDVRDRGRAAMKAVADEIAEIYSLGHRNVLQAVTELSENIFVDVFRALSDEENANALRSDQSNDLLDLIEQRFARTIEDEVRLIEEEDQLGFVEITDLGQVLLRFDELTPNYRIVVDRPPGGLDVLTVEVEHAPNAAIEDVEQLAQVVSGRLAETLLVSVQATVVRPGTFERIEAGKAKRVFDRRTW